jgi:hypothetical protein
MSERPKQYIKISERLLQLELRNGFFEITIDGIPIWERIRYWTQQRLLNELGVIDTGMGNDTAERHPVRRYIERIVEAGLGSVRRNPFMTTGSQILVWGHERRKRLRDGMWWDIYFDPLYEQAPLDYMHIETKHAGEHRRPAKTPNLRYFDLIEFIADLNRKVGIASYELSSAEEHDLRGISETIADEFDVEIDISQKVKNMMMQRVALKPLYQNLLNWINPDIVLLVVSYFRETFVETCKEVGIPVVEVQHGSPTYYQFGYSYPGTREKLNFPDYLFTFGEYWADTVPFPIDDSRIFPVGYPHLEQQASCFTDSEKKNQIVVVSQPAIGDELAALTVELSQSKAIPHEIAYKLHPSETEEWERQYPQLVESGARVISDEDVPLYELFAESTVQVGVYSTALYEGIHFGLKTFIYNVPGAQQMSDLTERNYAQLVGSVTEIEAQLENMESETTVNTEKMFRSNAVENALRGIRKVIAEHNE